MERLERVTLLHRVLKAARFGRTVEELSGELGCSKATVHRDLIFLRDVLGAPLAYEGTRYHYASEEHSPFELPGLWLSADELYALVLTRQVVQGSGEGLLGSSLNAVQGRIERMLGAKAANLKRLRVIRHGHRKVDETVFRAIALAVLERRCVRFRYRARSTDEDTHRNVHPQRLIHYRDNWYLDGYDDTRNALRSFALDRIQSPELSETAAQDVPAEQLDAELTPGYGIFSGTVRAVATIRFSAHAARWAAEERWHSKQEGRFLSDGRFELKVPYANVRELLMDVLRYGPDAEIVGPVALREQMRSLLSLTADGYETSTNPQAT